MKEKDLSALIDSALTEQIYFILDKDGNHVPCDVTTWAPWFENIENRIIKKTKIKKDTFTRAVEYVEISTVFLGMSHGTDDKGRPLLYETAWTDCRDSWSDTEVSERCATRDEAILMHQRVEEKIKAAKIKRTAVLKDKDPFRIDGTEAMVGEPPVESERPADTVSTPEELEAKRNFSDALKKL